MMTCNRCGETKPEDAFTRDRSRKTGRKGHCKSCDASAKRDAYAADPSHYKARDATRYEARREWLWELKSKPCTDCGLTWPPYVMQFDHIPGRGEKVFGLDMQGVKNRSMDLLLAEMAKCELVCANCHAIRTHERL